MGTVPEDTKFTDAKVCKNQLCGTCPHELFTNTVGNCNIGESRILLSHLKRRKWIWANVQSYTRRS